MRAQPNPRAAWPSHDDNGGFFLIVILVGSGILGWVLWVNFHATISSMVMALFHEQIAFLRHFTNRYDLADRQMAAADPADVIPDQCRVREAPSAAGGAVPRPAPRRLCPDP